MERGLVTWRLPFDNNGYHWGDDWCLGCCEINAGNADAHGADLHNDAAMFRDLKRKDLWLFNAIYGIETFEVLLIGNSVRLASISIIFEWLTSFQREAARNTRHAVASPCGGTPEMKAEEPHDTTSVVAGLPAVKLSQLRHNSSGTKEYTVRDALNEALSMSYSFIFKSEPDFAPSDVRH
jgi:hypothetical protein